MEKQRPKISEALACPSVALAKVGVPVRLGLRSRSYFGEGGSQWRRREVSVDDLII